jgi:alkaline phosphatase D
MFEYNPMRPDPLDPERVYRSFQMGPLLDVFMLDERSYRGANSPNRQTGGRDADFLGPQQTIWLKQALRNSRATWKVVASDMPISIVVPDLNVDVPRGRSKPGPTPTTGRRPAASSRSPSCSASSRSRRSATSSG